MRFFHLPHRSLADDSAQLAAQVDGWRNLVTNESNHSPEVPEPGDRMPVKMLAAPHPATLPPDQLQRQCDLRTQRRSGPGGQHRNKTSSGVFLQHQPTGIVAEATERRSQADNRAAALSRLRLKLAVEVRTPSSMDGQSDPAEQAVRQQYGGGDLRINERNEARPSVLGVDSERPARRRRPAERGGAAMAFINQCDHSPAQGSPSGLSMGSTRCVNFISASR